MEAKLKIAKIAFFNHSQPERVNNVLYNILIIVKDYKSLQTVPDSPMYDVQKSWTNGCTYSILTNRQTRSVQNQKPEIKLCE